MSQNKHILYPINTLHIRTSSIVPNLLKILLLKKNKLFVQQNVKENVRFCLLYLCCFLTFVRGVALLRWA